MSVLTRLSLGSRGLAEAGFLNARVTCIRNLSCLNSQFSPVLASITPSNKKPVQLVPVRMSSHGNHVPLWTAERVVGVALLPIIPAAFMFPSPAMDYLLAFTIAIHSHWGIEAIAIDYVRPSIFGALIPKIAVGLVYVLSALTFGGLCYFTYTDVGLVRAIKLLWGAK